MTTPSERPALVRIVGERGLYHVSEWHGDHVVLFGLDGPYAGKYRTPHPAAVRPSRKARR